MIKVIILLLSIVFLIGCVPSTPLEELEWCLNNKPQFNSSSIDGLQTEYKIKLGIVQQKCFTDHWEEYCKVSYPDNCPKERGADE